MTIEHDANPQLTTTGTGGRSARLVAVGVLVVLAGVVYVGMSGRNQANTAPAATGPVHLVAEATTEPTTSITEPPDPGYDTPLPYPGATVVVASDGTPSDRLGISLLVGGQRTVTSLDEGAARQFHAAYLVPLPVPAKTGAFVALVDRSRSFAENSFEKFTLPAEDFNVGVDPKLVVDVVRQPQPVKFGFTSVSNGYRLRMTIEPANTFAVLLVDLMLAADPVFPNERYDVVGFADGNVYNADVDQHVPGTMSGTIYFEHPPKGKTVTVQLSAIQPNDRFPGTVVIKAYEIEVPGSRRGSSTVDDAVDPDPRGNGLVGIIANGYHWQSSFAFFGGSYVLYFTLTVNPKADPLLLPIDSPIDPGSTPPDTAGG